MPPPLRYFLLQGKESDGDNFEKAMPTSTLPGKCWGRPVNIQVQGAQAQEKIFELAENTWAIYSTGAIDTKQVCPAKNTIKPHQI